MRFEKLWVQQYQATKTIKRRFGAKSALDYLIREAVHIRPGTLQLVIGKPIATTDYVPREMDKLSQRVQKEIEDMYYARSRVADPRKQEAAIEKP